MIYTTWCGKQVQTVSPDFFADEEYREWYYRWLNEDLCGSAEDPNESEDQGAVPDDKP